MPEEEPEIPLDEAEPPIHIPDLPLALRVLLLIAGWFVIVLGLAGLLLPGLQGILLLLLGAAILSVASDTVHRWLESLLQHRPHMRERLNKFRRNLRARLGGHSGPDP